MCVLAEIRLDDFGHWMTDRLDLSEHLQDAVLHLLHGIRNSVGAMHLDRAGRLVDSEFVPSQVELLVGERQVLNDGDWLSARMS